MHQGQRVYQTVPSQIVTMLGAGEGDSLNWIVEVIDDKLHVSVEKVEEGVGDG